MPSWGPLGQQVFNRTYSRPTAEGSESWQQTVSRVVEGNLDLVDAQHIEPLEATNLARHFENFSALPAGRHLWVSGVPGRQFLFNCHTAGWDLDFTITGGPLLLHVRRADERWRSREQLLGLISRKVPLPCWQGRAGCDGHSFPSRSR